jgi:hypothetical protein
MPAIVHHACIVVASTLDFFILQALRGHLECFVANLPFLKYEGEVCIIISTMNKVCYKVYPWGLYKSMNLIQTLHTSATING